MGEEYLARFQFSWRDREQYEWAREEAHQRRISMAELVRQIVDEAQLKSASQHAPGRAKSRRPV